MKLYRSALSKAIQYITIVAVFLVSQTAIAESTTNEPIDPATPTQPIQQGVQMTSQFPAPHVWINAMPVIGDPAVTPEIEVFMTLKNNSMQPINYIFPSSQTFDIFIKDNLGNVLSKWSRDMFFLQIITELSIAPGGSQTFGGSVSLTTIDNQLINPGDYTVSIQLTNINSSGSIPVASPASQIPLRIDWAF